MSDLPPWISEYLPKELVDSKLFKFNVELQSVRNYVCDICGATYDQSINKCTAIDDGQLCNSVKFKPVNKKITVDLLNDIDLSYDDLELHMQRLPAMLVFWSAVYSEARMKVALDERRLKAIKGEIMHRIVAKSQQESIKLSVEQVKNVVESDREVQAADVQLQFSQMQCGKLYHYIEALRMKAELARSLAGFKRQEFKNS